MREQTGDPVLISRLPDYLSWVLWDPRAAVAEIEQLRATNDQDAKAILELREEVGLRLGRSYEDQWRLVWLPYGYGQRKNPLDREFW